jgi:uncharacterized damage-inducible protein DinB
LGENFVMTWTAPVIARAEEPLVGPERPMLEGWLRWQRETLLHKCSGLTAEQLSERSVPPSDLSLLGLIRHCTDVERAWVRRRLDGQEVTFAYADGETETAFSGASAPTAEEDYNALLAEWRASDEIVARYALDDVFLGRRHRPTQLSCRWMLIHLIEEYARHNGHADLLRERIDGQTGS